MPRLYRVSDPGRLSGSLSENGVYIWYTQYTTAMSVGLMLVDKGF